MPRLPVEISLEFDNFAEFSVIADKVLKVSSVELLLKIDGEENSSECSKTCRLERKICSGWRNEERFCLI
jgi:serine protease inhibitor